ncbi:MAG: dockerin type I domain-containing protein [Planctomycetota bacterium]
MKTRLRVLLAAATALSASLAASADYSTDPLAPLAIRETASDDVQPKAAAAPNGGAYVSYFSGAGYDVRLTRLDADGKPVWKAVDILVEDRGNSSTTDYGLASDAAGNAYLAYEVGTAIICSSVAPDGTIRWRKTVSFAAGGSVGRVAVASDGFIWVAFIEGSATRVQRLDVDGNASFPTGVQLAETGASMFSADIQPSEAGAVIVSCVRYVTFSGAKILRAHRVNADGSKPWPAVGTSVFTTGSLQFGNFPPFISDGAGGAYFCWYTSSPLQCFAQRVNASGAVQYGTNGVAVTSTSTTERVSPTMVLGGDERLYVFWSQHTPNSSIYGTFGQCFSGGVRQWGDNGAAVAPLATTYSRTWATAATLNGGVACFYDDSPSGTQDNIRCGILSPKGTLLSTVDVALNSGVKYRLLSAPAPSQGSLLLWQGGASIGASDVFAARMNADGTIGPPPAVGNPADLNGDGVVNAADLSVLLAQWGGPGSADLNGDGLVGAADLSILLGAWTS